MKNIYKIIIFLLCFTGIGLLIFIGVYIKSKISYQKLKLYQKVLVFLSFIIVIPIFIWIGFFTYGLYEKYYLKRFMVKKPNIISSKLISKKSRKVR